MQEEKWQINLRMLGMYFACLGVLLFSLLVYENYKTIVAQKTEISRLSKIAEKLEWKKSELGFIRKALIAREPYYYETSLREEWGYRKAGEKLLSELPARHYISKGVPVHKIKTRQKRHSNWFGEILFYLMAGLAIAGIAFFLLFSVGISEKLKPDPVKQMRNLLFKKRSEMGGENYND